MLISDIIETLLSNRGLTDDSARQLFFHPTPPDKLPSPFDSSPAIDLINLHIMQHDPIFVYGDYDVDGICSTAILWETLHANYANVLPFIPHREKDGYGLSTSGLDQCLAKGAKLIITVDNGIVAHEQIAYCRSRGCDIVVIDHHEPVDTLPKANALLHSTTSCAAGLTWLFCRDFSGVNSEHLALVAMATICDIVPLLNQNRSFAKYGLSELRSTTRPGLQAIFGEASIKASDIGTHEVGFILGPRLNAMGRLEHAIDSLRLLCTKDPHQAQSLAKLLGDTNRTRQDETKAAVDHALSHVVIDDILIVSDSSYNPGIIGLIAGKLTEKYYRPSIAISIGEFESKASARSIPGFHITNHIRKYSNQLINVGGHAMAAGFTVSNDHLLSLLSHLSHADISPDLLVKQSRVDCEVPLELISLDLYNQIQDFAPFGLANPTPVFKTTKVELKFPKRIGKQQQHLKFKVGDYDAIAFNYPGDPPQTADIIYSLDLNTWNNQSTLQLIVKSIATT